MVLTLWFAFSAAADRVQAQGGAVDVAAGPAHRAAVHGSKEIQRQDPAAGNTALSAWLGVWCDVLVSSMVPCHATAVHEPEEVQQQEDTAAVFSFFLPNFLAEFHCRAAGAQPTQAHHAQHEPAHRIFTILSISLLSLSIIAPYSRRRISRWCCLSTRTTRARCSRRASAPPLHPTLCTAWTRAT